MLNIFGSRNLTDMYGLATAMPGLVANPLVLGGALFAWIAAPLGIAVWRFR
jgi:Cu-processing system permease protein